MKYYNELCQAWCKLDEDIKQAIKGSANAEFLDQVGRWNSVIPTGIVNLIYRAPIVEKQPLGSEDIKQGDIICSKSGKEWSWWTVQPHCDGVGILFSGGKLTFEELQAGYMIRSIGETEWRECCK